MWRWPARRFGRTRFLPVVNKQYRDLSARANPPKDGDAIPRVYRPGRLSAPSHGSRVAEIQRWQRSGSIAPGVFLWRYPGLGTSSNMEMHVVQEKSENHFEIVKLSPLGDVVGDGLVAAMDRFLQYCVTVAGG
jgi:hypothetical protein